MSYLVSWVKGVRQTSEVIDETLSDVSEAVIEGVCSLRFKYPNALRGGGILTPILDKLCTENNHSLPSTPIADFSGGQCPGMAYRVYYDIFMVSCFSQDGAPSFNISSSGTLWGPVTGAFVKEASPGGRTHVTIEGHDSSGNPLVRLLYDSPDRKATVDCPVGTNHPQAFRWDYSRSYCRITSIVPLNSGDVDNCGDPPAPIIPDPSPVPSDFTRSVEICSTPDDPDNQRCVTVDINFDPTLDEKGNQCFTIDGERYCFTPDGVEKQDDELPTEEKPSPNELEPTTDEDAEESSEEDENIVYVTTEITTFPSSGKSVFHAGTGNNDYFAGHFNWTTSTSTGLHKHPSIPIRKQLQIYVKPEEATGYTTYTVNGAKIKVVKYKKPVEGE